MKQSMKLVLIMICDEDKERVLKVLVEHKYTPTFIATTGSFLEFGKSLLLLGVEEDKMEELQSIVDKNTRRTQIKDGEVLKAHLYVIDSQMHKIKK